MRLTIVNLFISGRMKGERKRSATILARKPAELNPPSAGRRIAAGAGYRVGDVRVARPQPSFRDAPPLAQARNPYSPIVVMDSGLALRAPRNDDFIISQRKII